MVKLSCKEYLLKRHKILSHKTKASLTVEAALVLPVFIFAILAFVYLLQVLTIHNNFQEAITEIGLDSAKYGYVYENINESGSSSKSSESIKEELINTDDVMEDAIKTHIQDSADDVIDSVKSNITARTIDSIYYKSALFTKINIEALDKSSVKNGFSGVHTYLSTFMEKDDEVDIVINYHIEMPLIFLKLNDFQIVQRVKLRSWTGYRPSLKYGIISEEGKEEETVFIATTGTVYHTSRDCSHIRISIRNVPIKEVGGLRNKSGGKYTSCNLCGPDFGGNVFVATSGDRYHSSKSCSGLKRTIVEVPLSKVQNRNLCKRCSK